MEALRVAVHHPEKVAGRLEGSFFASDLARAAYEELASAMTLHEAIESAPGQVGGLLAQLAAVPGDKDPEDVLRRLLDRAAVRALSELQRVARADDDARANTRIRDLFFALQQLRSVDTGPAEAARLAEAEGQLLALLGAGFRAQLGTG
jgi:hypothetical protein